MRNLFCNKTVFRFAQSQPLLYIFAGQGTQEKGMLSDLLKIDEARSQIKQMSQKLGIDFEQIATTDSNNQINKTKITQPLLVLSQTLRFKYLNKLPLYPNDFMIGHSIGEYSALCIAKSVSLLQCLKLVHKRGQLMQAYTRQPSGMLIVRYADDKKQQVDKIVRQYGLQIACFNTPNNINIAGSIQKLETAKKKFKQQKITCLFLPVSAAFHCSLLNQMVPPFSLYISKIRFQKPICNIIRNLDSQIYKQDNHIKQGLVKHLINPVRFDQSIKKVNKQIQCIQIGHNQIVKKFVEETRKKIPSK